MEAGLVVDQELVRLAGGERAGAVLGDGGMDLPQDRVGQEVERVEPRVSCEEAGER